MFAVECTSFCSETKMLDMSVMMNHLQSSNTQISLMLSSVLQGLRIYIVVCCPSVLCYTEKLSSDVNGRLMTVKTAGGQELLQAIFAYTQTLK